MARILSKSAAKSPDRYIDLSSWDAVRDQFSDTVPQLLHRLPSTDEAKETLVSGAHTALERARGAAGAMRDQLPDLQEKISTVQMPRKQKRRGRPPLVTLFIVLAVLGGGFFLYKKLTSGSGDEEWMTESWPAEPAPASASAQQTPESDAQAEEDAEESAKIYQGSTPQPGT